MHSALLGLAATATAFTATPAHAQAQSVAESGFSAIASADAFRGSDSIRDFRGRAGHRHHIHVNDRAGVVVGGYAGGYYDEGDFDGNRSFDPDKWNDWWHERPERAFPRWMSHNENCQRLWWSGGGWRC